MKREINIAGIVVVLIVSLGTTLWAGPMNTLLIKLKPTPGVSKSIAPMQVGGASEMTALNERYALQKLEPLVQPVLRSAKRSAAYRTAAVPDVSTLYKLTFPKDANLHEIARAYEQLPEVEYAEPNQLYKTQAMDVRIQENQWALRKIEADRAWPLVERGIKSVAGSVVVAVVDTGVDYRHPDLAPRMWRNSQDNTVGWNFVEGNNDPQDDDGHGTHVAGVIASLARQSQLMVIRAGYKTADGGAVMALDDVAAGIQYAVDHGAKVINLSFGGDYSHTLDLMLQVALSQGVVIVAPVGNGGEQRTLYPASAEHVLAVGATDCADHRAGYSNYGGQLALVAPGSSIYSTLPNNEYGYKSGTSMATAYVSGLAALLLEEDQGLSREGIQQILAESSADLGVPGVDPEFGAGRINAYQALGKITALPVEVSSPPQSIALPQSTTPLALSNVLSGPNPFNPNADVAHIVYQLSQPASVALYIHAINGDLVYKDQQQSTTTNEFTWNGRNQWNEPVANGVYLGYVLAQSGESIKKQLVKIAVLR